MVYFFFFVQPQDFVLPLDSDEQRTKATSPQSHRHSQTTLPSILFSVGFTATSLPNRWPVKSFIAISFRKQPQDLVLPLVNATPRIKTVSPQSHRHSHTTALPCRSSVGRSATSLPNRCPVKSLNLFIGPLLIHRSRQVLFA